MAKGRESRKVQGVGRVRPLEELISTNRMTADRGLMQALEDISKRLQRLEQKDEYEDARTQQRVSEAWAKGYSEGWSEGFQTKLAPSGKTPTPFKENPVNPDSSKEPQQ